MRSIVSDALSMRPRNSPTGTKTSWTAKATPDTVMRKRSLSWRSVRVARSTMTRTSRRETVDENVDHHFDASLHGNPVHPGVFALCNLERHHAVNAGPDNL